MANKSSAASRASNTPHAQPGSALTVIDGVNEPGLTLENLEALCVATRLTPHVLSSAHLKRAFYYTAEPDSLLPNAPLLPLSYSEFEQILVTFSAELPDPAAEVEGVVALGRNKVGRSICVRVVVVVQRVVRVRVRCACCWTTSC
jgi:hypothetical protein